MFDIKAELCPEIGSRSILLIFINFQKPLIFS